MVDGSFVVNYRVERDRIRTLVATLSEADMAREVGDGWTVAALLAHMAFWDRMWLRKFEAWERSGTVGSRQGGPPFRVDALNAAMLPWWLAMESDEVRHEVVAAADAVDRQVESLTDQVLEQILAARPRAPKVATGVDRSLLLLNCRVHLLVTH